MKNEISFIGTLLLCLYSNLTFTQNSGDIAFTAFNADGDKDFAIVALADIAANSTIYITDDETTGIGSPSTLAGSEGTITWSTGSNIIKAGTVVVFTDIDNSSNPNFGVTVGTITKEGAFGISGSKDGLIAFIGTDLNTPTKYLAALQIGNDASNLGPFDGDGITLTNTGLVIGSTIIVIDNVASPDGGKYSGSRSNQTNYSDYKTLLADEDNNWTTVSSTGNGETLLEYSEESFTINTTNWTGNLDTDWNTAGNWDNGIPTVNSLVNIPEVTNAPIISSSTGATVGNIEITESNGVTMNSGSSLIINGIASGNITYRRTLTNNWHLISSPVTGETASDFITNSGNISTNGSGDFGIGTYNDGWTYNYNSTLFSGAGFAVKKSTAGDILFTGTLQTSNVSRPIVDSTSDYVLYGNPYTSYIAANTNANTTNNLLTTNTETAQDELSEATIWLWNQASDSYDIVNLATTSKFIAPGQGFFVKIKTGEGDGNFDFTEAMQSHQGTDSFQKNRNNSSRTEITIHLSDGITSKKTEIYYINGTTKSFDNGYDSSIFEGITHDLNIYTNTLVNNQDEKLGIQSLPNTNLEEMMIPIGIKLVNPKEITFEATIKNLPNNFMLFLEDKVLQTITRLDEENSKYKVALQNETDGFGRFYLHTSTTDLGTTLNTEKINSKSINIYLSSDRNLTVTNLKSSKTTLTIYDILGKIIFYQKLNANKTINITLSKKILQGVYIAKIKTDKGVFQKKILLK